MKGWIIPKSCQVCQSCWRSSGEIYLRCALVFCQIVIFLREEEIFGTVMDFVDLTLNWFKLEVHREDWLMSPLMSCYNWRTTRWLVEDLLHFIPVGEHEWSYHLVSRYLRIFDLIYRDLKSESRPEACFGLHLDRSLQLLEYHFRDRQAKTHTSTVYVLRFWDLPKELKELS